MSLLQIAIPTYNGQEYILSTLDSVKASLVQIDSNQISVCVYVNGSDDDTLARVSAYQLANNFFQIRNFEENLGYDSNILRVLDHVNQKYVWLLGDDDVIKEESIKNVLDLLENWEPSVLIIESVDLNRSEQSFNSSPIFETHVNPGELMLRNLWIGSALSSNVLLTEGLQLDKAKIYIGSKWIHLVLFIVLCLERVSSDAPAIILRGDNLQIRYNNPRWERNGNSFELGLTGLKIVEQLISKKNPSVFDAYLKNRYQNNARNLLAGLGNATLTKRLSILAREIRFYWRIPRFYFVDLPLTLLNRKYRTLVEEILGK